MLSDTHCVLVLLVLLWFDAKFITAPMPLYIQRVSYFFHRNGQLKHVSWTLRRNFLVHHRLHNNWRGGGRRWGFIQPAEIILMDLDVFEFHFFSFMGPRRWYCTKILRNTLEGNNQETLFIAKYTTSLHFKAKQIDIYISESYIWLAESVPILAISI